MPGGLSYRSALALAEAILPGSAHIPAADEATVARASEVVQAFDPRLSRAWRAAQTTLSAAAILQTGRPFYALSADRQEALLRRWEQDPLLKTPLGLVALVYRFVHFDRPSVYGAMGGKPNVVHGLEEPRWLRQVHRGEDWTGGDVDCEVVVVGTGAGGAVVGRELADRGLAVVFVEEGQHHRRDAFDGSSVSAHQRFYRGAVSVGNAPMPVFMGRLVGGSTAINGGTSFRTPPWVLDRWCEEIGTDEFSSAAMKPYFDRVEDVLEVGVSEKKHIGPIADVIARGCDALGWSHFAVRRNAPGCDGSGFCDFGCRTDARRGTNLAYVPPALERGAMLLTGLAADHVILEGGRAVGVLATASNGNKVRVRARAVVLAGGAVPTPLLLLKQDLANRSGEVGKNLTLHPSAGLSALMPEKIEGHRYIPQGYGCDQFLRDGILILTAQGDVNIANVVFGFSGRRLMAALEDMGRTASFALLLRDSSTKNGRVWRSAFGFPAITYNVAQKDADLAHAGMVHAGEMALAAGATRLFPASMKMPILEGPADWARFRKARLGPGDVMWTSYHPLGTCKMGLDPRTSVVGLDHETHDVPGLFIVDGSTVPGPLGVNPQITIMAMATRAATRIAARLNVTSSAA
jgi:choline dehydrogenase-like flavoprotein